MNEIPISSIFFFGIFQATFSLFNQICSVPQNIFTLI